MFPNDPLSTEFFHRFAAYAPDEIAAVYGRVTEEDLERLLEPEIRRWVEKALEVTETPNLAPITGQSLSRAAWLLRKAETNPAKVQLLEALFDHARLEWFYRPSDASTRRQTHVPSPPDFSKDRQFTIGSAARVMGMLAVDRAAPGSDLWRILDAAGAGKSVPPEKYSVEVIAFAAHVILAAFSIYTPMHGSFVSYRAHTFIADTIKDAELSCGFSDRAGEYNIAGGITAARPEAEWTICALVELFWENVAPGQELSAVTAQQLEAWVRIQLALGKEQYPTIRVVAD